MSTLSQFLGENINTANGTVNGIARSVLNSLYPSEFEVYFVSLELTDYNGNIEEYFTFPINPNSISKTEPRTKSIERTFGKIIVNKSDKFTPQDLTIKGNFGRDFKIILRHKGEISFNSLLTRSLLFNEEEFSSGIKSGYGSFKILQSICEKSEKSNLGRPNKLYFHNYLLGESYLVEVIELSEDQSLQSNMMWNYNLRLKILSPINRKDNFVNNVKTSLVDNAQVTLNSSLSSVRKVIGSIL